MCHLSLRLAGPSGPFRALPDQSDDLVVYYKDNYYLCISITHPY
jgi:hypothetical protein